jgi:hypothetical protein
MVSAAPSWTSVCVHPDGNPAPQFVGLTVAQANRLAEQDDLTLVVYGAAGKCLTQAAIGYAHPVEVNVDRLGPGDVIPQNAQVLTAQYGPARSVAFEGITFGLPAGWTVTPGHCGPPANHTVVLGVSAASCPGGRHTPPTTAAQLTTIYGPQFALSWPGHRTTWHGQPAWFDQQTSNGLTTDTLSLPWSNAVVTAQSGDPVAARKLLEHVSVSTPRGLQVAHYATSVFIQSLAGHDGDGLQRNATVTDPTDVQQLLADLRALTPVPSPRRACDGSWLPRTALLTVQSGGKARTYAARFDSCDLVIAGTNSAARANNRLLDDIKRLVPNSGL